MGSRSDWPTLQPAHSLLRKAGIPTEVRIVSAHRTPLRLVAYARSAQKRGLRILIAGAGGAAHLPGMAAALTPLPVLGIPVASKSRGLDSLLSIAQMPAGIPVATFPIGKKGATAAARFVIALFRHLS
jgi:5-(carboxyamino)imidazole ribonucleotide mutase